MFSGDMSQIQLTVEDVNRTLAALKLLKEKNKSEKEHASSSINSPGAAPINSRPILRAIRRKDVNEIIGLRSNRYESR